MAERNPPAWLQDGSHPADLDRRILESVFRTEGVLDKAGGDLLVTEQAAPTMGVTVAAGVAVIDGTESTSQGVYHVVNDADVDLAIAAADPTNPRIDLVIARVYDSFYGTAVTDVWALEVVTGTPAASPSEPAVPDNSHVLARVDVGASPFSSVSNAEITDRREEAVAGDGGLRKVVTFTSSGTFDKADYPWLRAVRVRLVGAGGGGGGASDTDVGGGGGGAGGYAESFIPVDSLAASETLTVGVGGNGNTGGNGSTGGATSFGSLVAANGGGGGLDGQASFNTYAGGVGGSATAGDFQTGGASGGQSSEGNTFSQGGTGGSSLLGGGGRSGNNSGGDNASGYGGGGGGGANNAASTLRAGGAGGDGVIIVELFG